MGARGDTEHKKEAVNTGSERGGWKERAEALFFTDSISISDIAVTLNKSRKTIARFILSHPDYERKKPHMRAVSADKRRQYQRKWAAESRSRKRYTELTSGCYGVVTAETMKREQAAAAKILSLERFCKE